MNRHSIEKLRRKLILTTTLSYALVMLLMASLIYLGNRMTTSRTRILLLNKIAANNGVYPVTPEPDTEAMTEEGIYSPSVRQLLFPEENALDDYERYMTDLHYFTVYFDETGEFTGTFIQDEYIISDDAALAYAQHVADSFFSFGSYDRYYYKKADSADGSMIVFLDSTELIDSNNRLLYIALILLGFGFLVIVVLVNIFSYKLIQPEIDNSERQMQFITNASHELKTPLAVIRANTEVEQMLNGENEWNQSTMRQVDRLTALIENLVKITRAEERDAEKDLFSENNITKAVQETIETFSTVAKQDGKQLTDQLEDNLMFICSEGDIRQLASLLIDNAIKYCDDGGIINVAMYRKGRYVHLLVSNSYAEGANVDYSRFFDRFYRQDEAHSENKGKGGFGIGLSIAESLVDRYRGKITATWKDGTITFHCQLQPQL